MDRIRTSGSEPLASQPRLGAPVTAAPNEASPTYVQDQFARIRPRTPEQATGMKSFDMASAISMAIGAGVALFGVGVLASGFLGLPLLGAAGLVVGSAATVIGLLAGGLGFTRWKAREALLNEG